MAVFIAYQWIINYVYPPRKPLPTDTQPAATQTAPAEPPATTPSTQSTQPSMASRPASHDQLAFTAGHSSESITIGGKTGDALEMTLTPYGAGVDSIRITQRENGYFAYRVKADSDEPYEVLDQMQGDEDRPLVSFATHRIRIEEYGDRGWLLDDLTWQVAATSETGVTFTTVLRAANSDQDLLRLTKTYELLPDQPLFNVDLTIENAGAQPLTLYVEQDWGRQHPA